MNKSGSFETANVVFQLMGLHPEGVWMGIVLGLGLPFYPVFFYRTEDVPSSFDHAVLGNYSLIVQIPRGGLVVGKALGPQGQIYDMLEMHQLLRGYSKEQITFEWHPTLMGVFKDLLALPPDSTLDNNDVSVQGGDDECSNDDPADSLPAGKPEGDGADNPAGNKPRTVTVGKRPKS